MHFGNTPAMKQWDKTQQYAVKPFAEIFTQASRSQRSICLQLCLSLLAPANSRVWLKGQPGGDLATTSSAIGIAPSSHTKMEEKHFHFSACMAVQGFAHVASRLDFCGDLPNVTQQPQSLNRLNRNVSTNVNGTIIESNVISKSEASKSVFNLVS